MCLYGVFCLEDLFEHKFVLNPCFDTLFVVSSAFSETRAFRSNRADLVKMHVRNFCATRAHFSTTWALIPATERNFKNCTFCMFWARALLHQPSGIFSLHKFVYQLVLQVGCNPIFEPAEQLQNSFPNRDTNLVTGMGAQSSLGNWEDLVNIAAPKFEVSVSPKMGPPAGP